MDVTADIADFTLWPFFMDCQYRIPFTKSQGGDVVDSRNRRAAPYPEVSEVLRHLHEEGYVLAVASRIKEGEGANQLLSLYGWDQHFTYKEIYPGSKIAHFESIKRKSGLEFSEMLFFDDEEGNRRELATIGVLQVMVRGGVTRKLVKNGLKLYAK
ncbi:hypothetical protein Pcinc_039166 [Petrolisthes cinctipes]|uniref:Magnesium-dependent phosphatase 1 n=1 Tax=Petrolisthes cinctipes TaxID=88211 RepID=A0AAE1BP20_PETCI|nr:hypothetical protein Pcinc_039166 [Petrolisthes cinctipes]